MGVDGHGRRVTVETLYHGPCRDFKMLTTTCPLDVRGSCIVVSVASSKPGSTGVTGRVPSGGES